MPRIKGIRLTVLFFTAGIVVGISLGLFLTRNIPEVDSLQFTTPHLMTRIYSRDGQVLQEYGAEKRTMVQYADVSPNFFHALIAVEDADFYHHHGVSIKGALRALVKDLLHLSARQGGSTLTQQLARQYFLTPEKTISRKIKEMILAVNIESHYTKSQILQMYANKVCFGKGYYGVEASSRYYFGKPAKDLTIPEAAVLAGVIQRPSYYSPSNHPDHALVRRNLVLSRMWKTGYITRNQYEKFRREPLGLYTGSTEEQGLAAYVTERIRMYLEDKYGEEALYQGGLQVYTTIDAHLQALATKAVRDGLDAYGRRRRYKGPERGPNAPREYTGDDFTAGERYWATVRSVGRDRIEASMGKADVTLTPKDWDWISRLNVERTFRPGDRILLLVTQVSPTLECQLDQEPLAQAALVAMDPHTGEVLALVGGYDFATSMYNRAVQARRQTGSAIKPIVYAAALSAGKTLASTVVDTPTLFLTGRENADKVCDEGYIPRDFDREYFGLITYRTALAHSINIAAVKVLNETGYSRVIDLAHQLHITSDLQPYPSMALGAFGISLWELTGAYTAFDNGGIYVEPRYMNRIADRNGKTLQQFRSESRQVLDPRIAFLMTQAMESVVREGTAASAADLKGHFAGKTGTTDKYTDSWFMGYNPAILCGVWAGKDDHTPLGNLETGARVALPIWREFMEPATESTRDMDWPEPKGVTQALIDAKTGKRAGVDSPCTDVKPEFFIDGTEPSQFCSQVDHFRLQLPHFLQTYSITPDLQLVIPAADLNAWVARYPGVVSWPGGDRLIVSWAGSTFPVKVEIAPPREGPVPQAVMPGLPHEGDVACGARTVYVNEKR